jgi:putative chitinase
LSEVLERLGRAEAAARQAVEEIAAARAALAAQEPPQPLPTPEPTPEPQRPPAPAPAPATGLQDPAAFFAYLKASTALFPRGRTAEQVEGIEALLSIGAGRLPLGWMAAVLGQVYHETGTRMVGVREKGSGDGPDADPWDDYLQRYDTGPLAIRLGNTPEADGDGVKYAGIGPIQVTGAANMKKMTAALRKLGFLTADQDLLKNPELLLDRRTGAASAIFGMRDGLFTGRKLNDYVGSRGTIDQFRGSRWCVNAQDRATLIAEYCLDFQEALEAGVWL